MAENISKIKIIVDYLISSQSNFKNCKIISKQDLRSSSIINIIIENLNSDIFIDMNKSIALSNGSACNSGVMDGSHVLKAMDITS